jgi:V/A-type H+/Na+-transporting ATPase subunit I
MRWPDGFTPARMERVAVVAPSTRLRDVLVVVADAGVVEPELFEPAATSAARSAVDLVETPRTRAGRAASGLASETSGAAEVVRSARPDELPGEVPLDRVARSAVQRGAVSAIVGWSPADELTTLAERLRALGGGVVRLARPRGADPPTFLPSRGATRAFQRLVDTYATVPYADLNPSAIAGVAYVVMFGMMFGDVGHGLLLVVLGMLVHLGRPARLARWRWAVPFVLGAGMASALFGLAYGDAFGPTGLVPTLWLSPVDHATTLLAVAIAAGAVLLAISYAIGSLNRWREGGVARALVALSGLAGLAIYLGLALIGLGWYRHVAGIVVIGGVSCGAGLVLGFGGLYLEMGGRAAGAVQAGVEVFDAVVRLGVNAFSFARLAAFGLTHAALGAVVWSGTTGLWHRGPAFWLAGAGLFVVGNAVAFGLEGLIAGVQALRLEYYELFSRIFVTEGRAFRPWHVPMPTPKETPCSPG